VQQHQGDHASQWAAVSLIAARIGCIGETPPDWLRQRERDSAKQAGTNGDDRDRINTLERENRERHLPTRSCARQAHILPKRRSPWGAWRRCVSGRIPDIAHPLMAFAPGLWLISHP